jgi:hypothetical protein
LVRPSNYSVCLKKINFNFEFLFEFEVLSRFIKKFVSSPERTVSMIVCAQADFFYDKLFSKTLREPENFYLYGTLGCTKRVLKNGRLVGGFFPQCAR